MHIDVLFLIVMILAVVKGLRQGLIIAIFSLLGWMIGLAAALKLSAVAAGYLKESLNVAARWLPVLSFAAVFIIVMLLVRLGAGLIQKTIELGMMGWANRIGGILLYILLYSFIFSVILFYAEQLNLVNEESMSSSWVYLKIKPMAPMVIEGISNVIPFFKDTFAELKDFFGTVSQRIPPK